jgi:hypothetical protein
MMKRILLKHGLIIGAVVCLVAIALPVAANAQNVHAQDAGTVQATAEEHKAAVAQTVAEHKVAAQTRLAATKLKVCQNRQQEVTNIMTRIADRGQKQVNLFSTIATRVETFYTNKGKTLANYDALVADVATQKAAALSAVAAVKSASTTFDCTADNPKGIVDTFKAARTSEITALRAYKTAVKNLIVGVKSVQGTTTSTDNKSTGSNQ